MEECGISGIILNQNAGIENINSIGIKLYLTLYALQHRGQDSMGIFVNNNDNSFMIKTIGLVSSYPIEKMKNVNGFCGIGHVRSAVKNTVNIKNCQPFLLKYKNINICFSFNGSLINRIELKHLLKKNNIKIKTESDCEIISKLFVFYLSKRTKIESIKYLISSLKGAYSLLILFDDTLYAIRDPHGIKPLCYGKLGKEGYIIASESVALNTINAKLIRDINPGEIVEFTKNGKVNSFKIANNLNTAHCVFEYIYIARPDSIIDGKLVYEVREKIGKYLSKENINDRADFICPIPDSGIISAIGYSNESKIKYIEGIVKNKYVGRTFIMPTQEERKDAVNLKLNIINSYLKDKSIIFVDDSIVRGTTLKKIIEKVNKSNPKEVHIRIGSPPIISPCYFGVDISDINELLTNR